ncbi:MAG: DnaA N-terminal domain-containing protein, partial [Planctomycetota bacterium]|nr:DnaA N-terminal domain-containing protein [Planctomycetota bacterium]
MPRSTKQTPKQPPKKTPTTPSTSPARTTPPDRTRSRDAANARDRPDPRVTDRLADRIGQHRYGMWFDHTTRLTIQKDRLDVAAESQFVADWIKRHFRQDLEAVARETIGENGTIELHVSPESFGPGSNDGDRGGSDEAAQRGPRAKSTKGGDRRGGRGGGARGRLGRRQQ